MLARMHARWPTPINCFAVGAARPLALQGIACDASTHPLDGYRCADCARGVEVRAHGAMRGPCVACGKLGPLAGYTGPTPPTTPWSMTGFGNLRIARGIGAIRRALEASS